MNVIGRGLSEGSYEIKRMGGWSQDFYGSELQEPRNKLGSLIGEEEPSW